MTLKNQSGGVINRPFVLFIKGPVMTLNIIGFPPEYIQEVSMSAFEIMIKRLK